MVAIGAGQRLTIEDCVAVAQRGAEVTVAASTLEMLAARRQEIVAFIQNSRAPAYGFNRGFGHNAATAVPPDGLAALQQNIIRSHASGVGPAASAAIVRAAMLLRAHSLAQGHSGVRPVLVTHLVTCLNVGITPEVPQFGSVGASGDLAPLSHIALALMGEGRAYVGNRLIPAREALAAAALEPLQLEMKEGLALNNGVQFSTAQAVLALHECRSLLHTAVINSALAVQVLLGSEVSFDDGLHALRPHPGSQTVARWMRGLLRGADILAASRDPGTMQDPYSLRCTPQILGACQELLDEAAHTFLIEMNSVTDNPLILSDDQNRFTRVLSGGHFHGMPVAVKLYNIVQAAAIMARLSNMRCARFVDERRNFGLGNDLIWPKLSPTEHATSSGMMVAEYASAALTNYLWGMSMPSHLFSISTDAGQEDHVSMSAGLAVRVREMLPRLAETLALELAFCHQAAAIRKTQVAAHHVQDASGAAHVPAAGLSPVCEKILARVGEIFPVVTQDRSMSVELRALAELVLSGEIASLGELEQSRSAHSL